MMRGRGEVRSDGEPPPGRLLNGVLAVILSMAVPLLPLALTTAAAAQVEQPHPDFSGVWMWHIEPGKSPFAPPGSESALPFTPAGKKKVDEYRALIGPTSDNPGAHCLGSGMPESMMFSGGYPMEIIQRPDQITVIYEAHDEIRRLYFGKKIIPEPDRVPARNGFSAAHWEGDTLVVETTSLKEQEDQTYPHSEQARITERYRLTTEAGGAKVLVAQMTLTDPTFYTVQVKAEKRWTLDPKGMMLPYECDEETWLDHLEQLKKQKSGAAARVTPRKEAP